ncbi:MAG TPA: serine/threonine-protein kinase [Bryobacteraceae bacterium]|jgi:serine/threonine protein kinase|nr:serine/threonine-protein kinase [Bryobacteraceae bacterium]
MRQGDQVGKYEIVRQLGRGMTQVYLALDVVDRRTVALKLVEGADRREARSVIEAEKRGARLQQALHHANRQILEVYEWGELEGRFLVALEYFEGRTLAEILQAEGRLEPKRACRYAAEICRQLRVLHEFTGAGDDCRGAVIHGDIKPSNVQISSDDELRLLDFGIAKTIRPGHDLTHHELGSPSYCSPERLREYRVDVHADLWAVGVTLYEMLAGALPFEARDTRELERVIQSRPAVQPPPDCPPQLASILRKALAPQLADRFQSAAALEKELRRYLEPVPQKRTIFRRSPARQKTKMARRAAGYSTVAALLAGVLAGLLLFLPLAYHLRLERISQTLNRQKDYSRLTAADLASDWRVFQMMRSRSAWWRRLVSTEAAEARFRSNLFYSAGAATDAFRRGQEVNWAQARLCAWYELQLDPQNRQALGHFHLASAFVDASSPKKSTGESYREFRKALLLLPRSPVPHLGLARLYTYRAHNVGAAVAEWQRAQALGYQLRARELEQEGDAYLYRAEQEFDRARGLPSDAKAEALRAVRLAESDFERARSFYQPINGFSQSGANLERIDEAQNATANFETALLTTPSPKPRLLLLKVRFGGRSSRLR